MQGVPQISPEGKDIGHTAAEIVETLKISGSSLGVNTKQYFEQCTPSVETARSLQPISLLLLFGFLNRTSILSSNIIGKMLMTSWAHQRYHLALTLSAHALYTKQKRNNLGTLSYRHALSFTEMAIETALSSERFIFCRTIDSSSHSISREDIWLSAFYY